MKAWRSIGGWLSRRTLAVIGGVVALSAIAAMGLAQLDFATGQNSYIDPSSKVAQDNARYQSLFGGENMVVLFTVPDGKTVVDLFTPATIAQLGEVEQQLKTTPTVQALVSPVTLLTWTQDLITSGTASEILARTIEREPDPAAQDRRRVDATITTLRLGAAGKQDFGNPEWVRFLVFGNDGFSLDADGALVAPPQDELWCERRCGPSCPIPVTPSSLRCSSAIRRSTTSPPVRRRYRPQCPAEASVTRP